MRRITLIIVVVAVLMLMPRMGVASYEISWRTIDGGGGPISGGNYTLTSTFGQADAGRLSGGTYTIDGGDFSGVSLQADIVPWKGPALGTWLTRGDRQEAAGFPPLVTVSLRYTFTYLQQSDWDSNSEIWDWQSEKIWRPGYKNILMFQLNVALMRVGVPLILYARYRNLTWIGGRNTRAADVWTAGIRVPARFW